MPIKTLSLTVYTPKDLGSLLHALCLGRPKHHDILLLGIGPNRIGSRSSGSKSTTVFSESSVRPDVPVPLDSLLRAWLKLYRALGLLLCDGKTERYPTLSKRSLFEDGAITVQELVDVTGVSRTHYSAPSLGYWMCAVGIAS
jgi:hypothetical protein